MPQEMLSPSTDPAMDAANTTPAADDPNKIVINEGDLPAMPAPEAPAADDPNKIVITEEDTKPTEIVPDPTNEMPAPAMDAAPAAPAADDPNKIVINEGDLPAMPAPEAPAAEDSNRIVITEEDTKPTEIVPDPTNEMPAPAMDAAPAAPPAVDSAPWSPGANPMGAEQPAQSSETVASTPEAMKEMSTADAIITLAKAANLSPEDSKKIAEELSK